jgi:hypothetical protein
VSERSAANSFLKVGTRREVLPIPPVPGNTEFIPAGNLTIAVEYRLLTDVILNDAYKDDPEGADVIARTRRKETLNDEGVSIHVMDNERNEYLRFDCFSEDPHYHYIQPEEKYNILVPFDVDACGDMVDWVIERLSSRLEAMLAQSGGSKLVEGLNKNELEAAIPLVLEAARRGALLAAN